VLVWRSLVYENKDGEVIEFTEFGVVRSPFVLIKDGRVSEFTNSRNHCEMLLHYCKF
jgi:hypothetical protein